MTSYVTGTGRIEGFIAETAKTSKLEQLSLLAIGCKRKRQVVSLLPLFLSDAREHDGWLL